MKGLTEKMLDGVADRASLISEIRAFVDEAVEDEKEATGGENGTTDSKQASSELE